MRRHTKAFLAVLLAACGDGAGPPPPTGPVATQLSVASQPSSTVQNGVALTVQPVIRLRDAAGVPVSQAGVVVTATLATGTGVTLANATATTNAAGFAGFSGLTLTGLVGSYTLRFSSGTLTPADANLITVTPGAPTQLAMAVQPSATAQAGIAMTTQPAVRLRDASGNDATQAGITVTAELVSGTLTLANPTATTNASGVAAFNGLTLSGLIGSYTLRFTAPNLTSVTATAATQLQPGAPTQVAMVTAPSGTAQNGVLLTTQPVIRLRDAFGNDAVQAGVRVTAFIVSGPAGDLAGDTIFTDANGSAAFTGLSITGPVGTYSLRYAASGFAPIVSATVLGPGAATKLGITTPPQASVASGASMTAVPVIQVQDQSGNAVSQAGVTVTASLVSGSVGLTNATAITDATGKATFTGLTLTGVVNSYLLQFTATNLTAVTAVNAVVLLPGTATQMTLATQPSTSASNAQALAAQPVIQLRDAQGNAATAAGVVITASLVSGSAVVASGTATTVTGGTATFSGLAIVGTTGTYRLRFGGTGMTPLDAAANTVLGPGVAKAIVLTQQPATTGVSGSALTTQPVAQLVDTSGNNVPQGTVTITASVVGGGSSVSSASAITTAAGTAVFAGLAVSGPPGSYVLRFSSGTLVPADASTALALSAGPPAQIRIITVPPSTTVNGIALGAPPVIEVTDATGNPLAGVNVSAGVSGGVTLANTQQTTGSNGRATFTGLTMTGPVSGHSLRFCIGTSCATATIIVGSPVPTSITVGAPATVTITDAPSASGQSGVVLADQPVVRVTDVSGNVIGGVTVTASAPSLTLGGASVITSAAGIATFATLGASGAPGSYTLTFTAGTATDTSPFTLTAGAPASVSIDVAPPGSAENGEPFSTVPVVTVRDVTGNGIPDLTVTASPSSSDVSVVNGSATTNGSGVATFTGIALAGIAGGYTLTFTAGGVDATTGSINVVAGNAASLTVMDPPSISAVNGAPLTAQPRIRLLDGTANPIAGHLVTASVVSGSVTLAGATAITDGSGDATFSGLTLNGLVGSYTLRFRSGALSVNAPAATSLTAGPAAALIITTQPSLTAQNDAAFGTQPVVQVTDIGGNAVAQSGTQVTASLVSGGAVVGSATATTGPTGDAVFSGLKLTGPTGTYRLRFGAPGLGSVNAAANTTLGHGVATSLSVAVEPSTEVTAGQVLVTQPVVQLRDVSGNAVSQAGIPVTIGSLGNTATLTGTTTVATNATGQAVFTNVGVGPQGLHELRFTSGALTAVTATLPTFAATPLVSAAPPPPQGAPANQFSPFVIAVPAGADSLVVEISGGTGSADLIVRHGAAPELDPVAPKWDCFPNLSTNDERCVFASPAAGNWYVVLYAFFSYTGVTLRATVY